MINLSFINKAFIYRKIPFFSVLIFNFMSATISVPAGFALNIPAISIISIVFWILHLGTHFNKYDIFFLGILNDILVGTPLGSFSLIYILISLLANYLKYKTTGRNSIFHFLIAFFIILTSDIIFNITLIILNQQMPSLSYILFNYLLTISLYPAFFIIFRWIYDITKLKKYYAEV